MSAESSGRESLFDALRSFVRGLPRGYYSERQIKERRDAAKTCICPSHASNRGECPVHDHKGRVRQCH